LITVLSILEKAVFGSGFVNLDESGRYYTGFGTWAKGYRPVSQCSRLLCTHDSVG